MKKVTTSERRVLVLGGGVIGVTTAYALAKRGFEVTVVERQDGVGLETSFANGSLITPSMADPWAAPGLPLKLLKWIGREPLFLRYPFPTHIRYVYSGGVVDNMDAAYVRVTTEDGDYGLGEITHGQFC